jgi:hypothetical protein
MSKSSLRPGALQLLLAFGAGALVAGSLGAKKPRKMQRAERYQLVDDAGVVRGEMGTWADGPYLKLEEPSGAGVTVLTHHGEVSLSMYTEDPRHPRVHVLAGEAGSNFTLLDRNGRASVRVELDDDGRLLQLTQRPEQPIAHRDTSALRGIWNTTPRE